MDTKRLISCLLFLTVTALPISVSADTYIIPFSDIRQAVDGSNESPDTVIHDYLAEQIRDELDALGLNIDGGLVFGEVTNHRAGVIRADQPAEALVISAPGRKTNEGLMEAVDKGILSIEMNVRGTGTLVADGGTIRIGIDKATRVEVEGSALIAGRLRRSNCQVASSCAIRPRC